MADCKHFHICGLSDDADPEAGLCILHTNKPGKSKEVFTAILEEHRKKNGDNFALMVFPDYAFSGTAFTNANFKCGKGDVVENMHFPFEWFFGRSE